MGFKKPKKQDLGVADIDRIQNSFSSNTMGGFSGKNYGNGYANSQTYGPQGRYTQNYGPQGGQPQNYGPQGGQPQNFGPQGGQPQNQYVNPNNISNLNYNQYPQNNVQPQQNYAENEQNYGFQQQNYTQNVNNYVDNSSNYVDNQQNFSDDYNQNYDTNYNGSYNSNYNGNYSSDYNQNYNQNYNNQQYVNNYNQQPAQNYGYQQATQGYSDQSYNYVQQNQAGYQQGYNQSDNYSQLSFEERIKAIDQKFTGELKRKRRKTLIINLSIVVFAILIAIVSSVVYVYIKQTEVKVQIELVSSLYKVDQVKDVSTRTFKLTEKNNNGKYYTGFEQQIEQDGYVQFDYNIRNNIGESYTYNVSFDNVECENCIISYCTSERGKFININEVDKNIKITTKESIVIFVKVEINDIASDARCEGDIIFTISVG